MLPKGAAMKPSCLRPVLRLARASAFAAALLGGQVTPAAPAPAAPAGGVEAPETVVSERAVTDTAARDAASFDAVVERIRTAAASGEWERPGWDDVVIARGLANLLDRVKRGTGRNDLALPVEFADVAAPEPGAAGARAFARCEPGTLWVGNDADLSGGTRSIILAAGNVELGFAEECVIVAGGTVRVAHGRSNVILAGHFVHVSHDGNHAFGRRRAGGRRGPGPPPIPRPGADPAAPEDGAGPRGSLILSGGVIDVSHATGSVCSAPTLVQIAHARDVTFFNAPNVRTAHRQNPKQVMIDNLPLAPREKPNPIADKVKIARIIAGDGPRGAAVLDHGGEELPIRPGADLRDAAGTPLPGLEGWKLSFVGEEFALFSDGRDHAAFVVTRRD